MAHRLLIAALCASSCSGSSRPDAGPRDADSPELFDADDARSDDGDTREADGDAERDPVDGDVDDGDIDGVGDDLFRVMTWNLESFPSAPSTLETVAELIAELDADVIGIQEIDDVNAFNQLIAALPDYDGTVNYDPGGYIRLGLLYRATRVSIIEVDTLFEDDWYAFPRPPLMARFEYRDGEGNVTYDAIIMVVHLKAQLDDESQARRRDACEKLDLWVSDQLASGDEQDIIIVGDWNDELTDWGTHLVFEVFLEQPERYTFLTLDLAEAGGFTYLPFESFLDHILVTNDSLDEYGEGTTEILELERTVPNYEEIVSDHRPVRATFVGL